MGVTSHKLCLLVLNNLLNFITEDQNGEETMFKIKKTTKMKKVFATYAARKGVEATASE